MQESELITAEYKPRGICKDPMNPYSPAGCLPGFEPFVYRSADMVKSGDTFDPCCKNTGCNPSDTACLQKVDNRWSARVLRFADTAQYLITKLTRDIENIKSHVNDNKFTLETVFQANAELHQQATTKLQEYFEITSVIIRDLQRCLSVLTEIVDDDKRIAKAAVTPRGRAFDIMRAEAVGSGCASLESLLAIARTEYYPRFTSLKEILTNSIQGYRRTKKNSFETHAFARIFGKIVDTLSEIKFSISKVGIQTFAFYALTVVPFLYTSVFAIGTFAPAMLLASDRLTMLTRCLKLFCHFTQLPGLVIGLGVVLSNKMLVYFRHRQNQQKIDKEVDQGAVTFFSVLEKLVINNPTAAASIASMGALQAGARAVTFTAANISKVAVASLGNNPQIGFLCQIMQGILMFFMSILSSSIWKTIGFACKATVKLAAPAVEGTASIVGGTATLLSGFGHLTSQIYNAAGQTAGYGLEKVGTAANILGDKLGTFMDSFHVDAEIRGKLMSTDAALEKTLSGINESILRLLGVTAESLNSLTMDKIQNVFEPDNVLMVENFISNSFQQYKVELQLIMILLPIIYGTWTWFQPKTENDGLSAATDPSKEIDVDWADRKGTEYVNKFGRIIPRPPINFVYQQCLHEDPNRAGICKTRAQEWSGFKVDDAPVQENEAPPAYPGARSSSSRRSGSSRKRGSSRRLRKSVRRASLRRGSARRGSARRGSARRGSVRR